jgi:DGQHR domain-containing protein
MRKVLTPDQLAKLEKRQLSNKIQTTFKNAGFLYLPMRDKEVTFNGQTGDFDSVFLYENIILLCEETTTQTSGIKDHLKKKKIFYDEVDKCKPEVIQLLKADHSDKFGVFADYGDARYKIFYLYFTKNKFNPSKEVIRQFQPIKIVEYSSLAYLHELSKTIRLSSKMELYRFLGLKNKDIGAITPAGASATIDTNIIYPQDNTGMKNGVRVVSFMLSASQLMKNAYVLRKDNWQDSVELYQRLVKPARIQNIRKHLATKEAAFVNNIIVSLPDGVRFSDTDGNQVCIEDIQDYEKSYTMSIVDEFNSICIIDGQHRVYAHHEGGSLEEKIAPLRDKLHLLVTGLIFPLDMDDQKRRTFESEIFLDINSNARPVPPDVLLFIQTLQDPFSGVGIARRVLERLNQRDPFHNLFQMSSMEDARIKIASIIKFALKGLVEVNLSGQSDSLYYFWSQETGKDIIGNKNKADLDEYIDYVVSKLSEYFNAFKSSYTNEEWLDPESKILSTTSINGFIIAYRRLLDHEGIKNFQYYAPAFKKLSVEFKKDKFPYTSSQYRMFSKDILKDCFSIIE